MKCFVRERNQKVQIYKNSIWTIYCWKQGLLSDVAFNFPRLTNINLPANDGQSIKLAIPKPDDGSQKKKLLMADLFVFAYCVVPTFIPY